MGARPATEHERWMHVDTILGTTRPSGVFSAGTHETLTLVPTTMSSDHLYPIPLHPDEVSEFEAAGWRIGWRVSA